MTAASPVESTSSVASGVIARFAQIAVGFVVEVLILFLGAGRLNWIWAWIFTTTVAL
jgi:hypothetical protein